MLYAMENLNQSFKNERQKTDNSLDVERGKTDQSFDLFKEKSELKTDQSVSDSRDKADQARAQRRTYADSLRDGIQKNVSDQSTHEKDIKNLQDERKSEDSAIKKERLKNDLALDIERTEKEQLLSQLVSAERETTDKNLSEERKKTDHEAKHSTALFDHERKAHLDTKSDLTTREEFVAIVSHDLRNPIGAILSFSEILLDDPSVSDISPEAKHWIEIIKRNAESSLRLIGDILDMERIEGGKIQLQMNDCRLSDIIIECVDRFRHVANAKNITLNDEKINLMSLVNCDKDRVTQIISNLLCNAIKFTPEFGSVSIKAEETDSEIKITVNDTGPGIPKEQESRIFDRFTQLGNKDRRGLGLGLYISKTLVESHNGKIGVISKPGHGSTFYFTLPK